jgi:hypothetical protein
MFLSTDLTKNLHPSDVDIGHISQIEGRGTIVERRRQIAPNRSQFVSPGANDSSLKLDDGCVRIVLDRYS